MNIDTELLRKQLAWLEKQDAEEAEGLANLVCKIIAEQGCDGRRDAAYMRRVLNPDSRITDDDFECILNSIESRSYAGYRNVYVDNLVRSANRQGAHISETMATYRAVAEKLEGLGFSYREVWGSINGILLLVEW